MSASGWSGQYRGIVKGFAQYWRIYGGLGAVLGSPYFLVSVLITVACYPLWLRAQWWDQSITILPGILSFSLGGFAILLAFGDEGFRALISGVRPSDEETKPSPYLRFTVTFVHFILLQVAALIAAVLAKAWFLVPVPVEWLDSYNAFARPVFWAIGFWLLMYSLLAAVAAVMAIFVLARTFDGYHTRRRNNSE